MSLELDNSDIGGGQEPCREMKTWNLGKDGYIEQYMVTGPVIQAYESDVVGRDQLEIEKILRREISSPKPDRLEVHMGDRRHLHMGEESPIGAPWRVYAPYETCFVDVSDFYSTLQRVQIDIAALLVSEEEKSVRARVWTYMSAGIYLNGRLVGESQYPVYKPMNAVDVTLNLQKGENELYFICHNLGARDTRNLLGLQILESEETKKTIGVALADRRLQDQVYDAENFLRGIRMTDRGLVLPHGAGENLKIESADASCDFYRNRRNPEFPPLGKKEVTIPPSVKTVRVSIENDTFSLERKLEFAERIQAHRHSPDFLSREDADAKNLMEMYERIGAVRSLDRGEFGFSVMGVLARRYLSGQELAPEDRKLLLDDLDCIEKRVDCADFLICGFTRYWKNYEMDKELSERLKEVLLGFRYWMNEPGSDAMCFWSENHSLMFYSSAMFAGERYPEEWFQRPGLRGRELAGKARKKVLDWLEDVEKYGFEEFLSTVYMNVTFAALLNLVDYGEKEIADRTWRICDRLVRDLCLQAFRKTLMAPMGRVYRSVLYPFGAGTQAILNMIDPAAPYCFGEGWMAYMATSSYEFPKDMAMLMEKPVSAEYTTGNALIRTEKSDHYILTSVQSPRMDGWKRWVNIRLGSPEQTASLAQCVDTDSHAYNKSLNESFHGTSFFQPGTHGYQQQLWMAALSEDAVLFINHPGTTSEESDMRPGYWHGNGVMPAICQDKNRLGVIYHIPDKDPIHFTHVYCPAHRFDEVRIRERVSEDHGEKKDGYWLFLKKDKGYMALWSSLAMLPYDGQIRDCELRVYGRTCAFYLVMGDAESYGSFEGFMKWAEDKAPSFEETTLTLTAPDEKGDQSFTLSYVGGEDETQYIA